jgi:hypothetical protein
MKLFNDIHEEGNTVISDPWRRSCRLRP